MRRWLILTTAAMLALGGLVPAVSPVSVASAAVPSGFTDTLVTTVSSPTTVVGLPDGRVVVLSKGGAVRIIDQAGALLPAAITFGGTCTNSEQGLLGFATDPAFSVNGFVYIYRTRSVGVSVAIPSGCVNRVSRFTMAGNSIIGGSEVVLVDNLPTNPGNHNGGDLEVGNDGFLYISVGDGACNARTQATSCDNGQNTAAQDLSLLNGKILRVDRNTGFAPPSNPLTGFPGATDCRMRGGNAATPTTWCKEIYAWGLRNPYRFAFDTNTGTTRFNINDVGQNKREEVDLGQAGANYGWPAREGICAQSANGTPCASPTSDTDSRTVTYCRPTGTNVCVQPILDYPHNPSTGGDVITGAAFVPNGAWPTEYDGGYFLADADPGKVVFRAANGTANFVEPFLASAGYVSDLNFVLGPTGWALWYVNAGNGQVRKITYNTAAAPSPGAMKYTPLATSDRVFDTRNAGADTGPIRAGTTRLVDLNPPSGTARAALVNLTFASTQGPGFVSSWTPRTTRPASSNLNASASEVVANSAIVPLDADGKTIIMSSVTADVVVDVLGFFDTSGATTAGRFTATSPLRIADTRNPSATGNTYTRTGTTTLGVVNVPVVSSAAGVPAGTSAVAVIVTALSGDAVPDGGYAVAYRHGDAVPNTSTVNVNGFGDTRANLAVVPVGADGSIDLQLFKTANVLVDVVGYFTGGGASSSTTGLFVSLPSVREIDSRSNKGLLHGGIGVTQTFNATDVPDNAIAIAQNLTITETIGAGFITSWPTTAPTRPDVSNGNATGSGQTRAAFSITGLGAGAANYYTFMNTHIISDFAGYFQG